MSATDARIDLERVEGLWFADADLILRAENSIFRVYSGILCAHSSFFRGMLPLPQPTQAEAGEETLDGRIIVQLQDKATETEAFLRAIFDSSFFEPPPSPVDFSVVIAILRLAHKFDVQYLFRRALSHLDSLYPVDLENLLRRSDSNEHRDHVRYQHGDVTVDMIALRAAYQVKALWLIPVICYSIAAESDFMNAAAGVLETHEIQMCLSAQAKLVRTVVSSYRFMSMLPDAACESTLCHEIVVEGQGVLHSQRALSQDMNPLSYSVFHFLPRKLCPTCLGVGEGIYKETQEEFWSDLPRLFGSPSWEDLKEMRGEVMGEGDAT
ncbi:BTB domain-containing protein [Favolaschia claudopus]|uniref:BTB domain-containing protein n=1 Tax=Favolaschia claudopus TaxID=2862362 RepID=A0AAW0EDV1_9AGAR